MAQSFRKDPDSSLDYYIDWAAWLDGDTIATSTWTAATGITIMSSVGHTATNTATTATVWLSGGTLGETYDVTNRITTAAGRTDDRTIQIRVVTK